MVEEGSIAPGAPGRVVVLGGAGAMGRVTVRDLFETCGADIVVADRDAASAAAVAAAFGSPRVAAAPADVADPQATRRLLEGAFAVVNAVQYQHNLAVMAAALEAGAHYVDLGGLFHVTRQQLEWHGRFAERGLLALLGMGAAPGTTNLLAHLAAGDLDEVREIHVRVAGVDLDPETPSGLDAGYSIQTVLEEAARPVPVVREGRLEFVEPLTPAGEVRFPEPVGVRHPVLTIHSEVATLPSRHPHLRECSFAIAFDEDLVDRLRFLRDIGVNSMEPLAVGGVEVVPHEVLLAALRRRPPRPRPARIFRQAEVLRAVVRGTVDGVAVEEIADCHVSNHPEWGLGLEVDTGCPPSIAVQMLASGEITARGALPPEEAVPADPYFRALARRRMHLHRSRGPW